METQKTLMIYEVFDKIRELKTKAERVEFLKKNQFKQLRTLLQLCYNDRIELDLPEGKPPYEKNPEDKFQISSYQKIFAPIGQLLKNNGIPQVKKEKIFIGMLEQLHPIDAQLLIAAKDGKIDSVFGRKYASISKFLVEEALPELLK